MIPKYKSFQTYGLWLLDTVCIFISFHISSALRYGQVTDDVHRLQANQMLIFWILFGILYNFLLDWNRDFAVRRFYRELYQILKFNILMLAASLVFLFAAHFPHEISRLLVGRFFLLNIAFMFVSHEILKMILRRVVSNDQYVTKLLIIAEKDLMEQTIERVRNSMDISVQIVGAAYVNEEEGCEIDGIPVLGNINALTEMMTHQSFDEVLINTPDVSQHKLKSLIGKFQEMGVPCHYSLELPDIGARISSVGDYAGYSVITYQITVFSQKKLIVKRAFDILGGLIGLLITGILTLFIAPAIKLDSPGPVFYSQERVGKNGRRFRIYKFRSMYTDADSRLKDLQDSNEMSGPMFKMENDPRITKVGAFLRKTSLDEFPQFLNVLNGDMSLVGTRPPTVSEFQQYDEHYRRRISMRPGLTGLWQVSGRSDITDFDEVVRLDLQYIDNWSLLLDAKLILQTFVILFTHKGAR